MTDPFDGTWVMNREKSTNWDKKLQCHVPEPLLAQTVVVRTEGDVQYNELHVQHTEDSSARLAFTCRFDDGENWVPYVVVETSGERPEPADELIAGFKPHREVGQPFEECIQVRVDERTHYQFTRAPGGGDAYYVRMRRMLDDGDSYIAVVLDTDGVPSVVKAFERQR